MNETTNPAQVTEEQAESLLGMEDLNSLNFDEIEEAPGFVVPPEGSYRLELNKACQETYKTKKEPNKQRRRLAHYYKIVKVVSLNDPKEKVPSEGSMFSERWQLTPDGLKYWKSRAKALLGDADTTGMNLGGVLEALNVASPVVDCNIKHKVVKNKEDGKDYVNIQMQVTGHGPQIPEDAGI